MDGIFDLLIPQAIGKWVQHGDACSINHGHHFVETQGDTGTRLDINKEKRAIQDRHGCPVCRAGRRGFASPISRVDLQDGDEDVCGEAQDSQATEDARSCSHNKNHPLAETGVSTQGEAESASHRRSDGWHGAAERKAKSIMCASWGSRTPSDIGTHHQLDSESLGHGDRIPQWVSNGATAAIGHRRQRKHPVATKNPKHPCCEAQPRKEMAFFLTKKSESILGLMTKEKHMSTTDNDWGKSTWGAKAGIHVYQNNHTQVSC